VDVEPLWALADASVGDSRSTCGHGAADEDYGSRFFAGASRASDLGSWATTLPLLVLSSAERAVSVE
jgi:hypothetical protein